MCHAVQEARLEGDTVWGPTPSRVGTIALQGSRSQASTIFARNVSAAGRERDRAIAKR